MANNATGIVYHENFLLHTDSGHPERKERLEAIMERLREKGVLNRLTRIVPDRGAAPESIALAHDLRYIKGLEKACKDGQKQLDMDTYLTPQTYEVARLAVQGGLDAVAAVMNGRLEKVFALLRPPGHHAEAGRGMGFCIFNNIAIAARVLQREYGLKRIMIVDWDVHHGNGTQQIFEEEDEVLFFSVHQSPAYPGTGRLGEVGSKAGTGYTLNAPLPPGCGDGDYLMLFQEIVIPVMHAFAPQILLVSAGQDAYQGDPLASMNLSKECYAHLAAMLCQGAQETAGGKIIFFLEGGYNISAQADIIYNVLNTMGDWGLPLMEDGLADNLPLAEGTIKNIRNRLREYWNILGERS